MQTYSAVMRTLGLLGLAALLTACAVTPPRYPTGDSGQLWRARQAALAKRTDWSFEGRIGVTQGEQGWHALLHWQQRAEEYTIRISARWPGCRVYCREAGGCRCCARRIIKSSARRMRKH